VRRTPSWAVAAIAVAIAVALTGTVAACGAAPEVVPSASESTPAPTVVLPSPTPRPEPGHELFGFVPYWEMDAGIADHLAATPLTTLALFSVTHTAKGAISTGKPGYRQITGDTGSRLIREAHQRGVRVELVFSSFGTARNRKLFESRDLQSTVVASLTDLAGKLGVDGINVDVEALDPLLVPAYGMFVGDLRNALRLAEPGSEVSVATQANELGAAMALAAVDAGADRVFLMGYDYRVPASTSTGASAPLDRSDGGRRDLRWSLDVYEALGVPVQRTILGLPLYGLTWPVAGPVIGAPAVGRGDTWILRSHVDVLADPSIVPLRDPIESVDVYLFGSDGSVGPPGVPGASAQASPATPGTGASPVAGPEATTGPEVTWQAVYVDSPATLAPKMSLALDRGLAGVGFWAIGYERGLPGYTDLMRRFVEGKQLS
jgi:Glycosyl hydrolases family 18